MIPACLPDIQQYFKIMGQGEVQLSCQQDCLQDLFHSLLGMKAKLLK